MNGVELRALRRRGRQRGAAFTEALIIAGAFVLIFACMLGAVRFHNEKIRVMSAARAQTWSQAVNACPGGGDVLDDIASHTDTAGSSTAPDTRNGYANVEDSRLTQDSGYTAVRVEGATAMPGLIGGKRYAPSGRMYIRCNEDPPADNLRAIAKRAMQALVDVAGF